MMGQESQEMFVMDGDVASLPADNASEDDAPNTRFAVHRPDQPPEDGGPVWIVEEASPEERELLQVALDEGLVADVPSHLLERPPVNLPDDGTP